jgi:hypothetical protein
MAAVKEAAEDFLRKLNASTSVQGEQINILPSPAPSMADTLPDDPVPSVRGSNFLFGDHAPSFTQWPGEPSPIMPHPDLALPLVAPKTLVALQKRNAMLDIGELHPTALHAALSSNNTAMRFSVDAQNAQVLCASEQKKYRVTSYQDWYLCFATFMAYRLHYFPDLTMSMMSYACYIAEKASTYSFTAVANYDEQFRLFLSLYPEHSWAVPNAALADRFFVASAVASKCNACQGPSHACPVRGPTRTPTPQQGKSTHCFKYQHGNCPSPCRQGYAHICSICKGDHPRSQHTTAIDTGAGHSAGAATTVAAGGVKPAAIGAAIQSVGTRFPQHQSRQARI